MDVVNAKYLSRVGFGGNVVFDFRLPNGMWLEVFKSDDGIRIYVEEQRYITSPVGSLEEVMLPVDDPLLLQCIVNELIKKYTP